MRADCIRVTHPYATLGQVLLLNLPFGLHVLGLPLAFILSQDQTLHSINPKNLRLLFRITPSDSTSIPGLSLSQLPSILAGKSLFFSLGFINFLCPKLSAFAGSEPLFKRINSTTPSIESHRVRYQSQSIQRTSVDSLSPAPIALDSLSPQALIPVSSTQLCHINSSVDISSSEKPPNSPSQTHFSKTDCKDRRWKLKRKTCFGRIFKIRQSA